MDLSIVLWFDLICSRGSNVARISTVFNNLLVSFVFSKTDLVDINTLRIVCRVWEVFVSGTIHDGAQQRGMSIYDTLENLEN